MPDMNCRHCGEPWDIHELHDFPNYKKAAAIFAKHGCGLFDADYDDLESATKCTNPVLNPDLALAAGQLQDDSPHPDDWLDAETLLMYL
jgi:hypothetical protein